MKIKPDELIEDETLYPRSEYYTRFEGSTAFVMDNSEFWATYHRGESTRFFELAGGRKNTQFFSGNFLEKPERTNSFFAHTGGINNPYSSPKYHESIKQTKIAPLGHVNVRDNLLRYKQRMAEQIVASFEHESANELSLLKKGCSKSSIVRPVVIYENSYPCVLVNAPILSPVEFPSESSHYWSKHPKPMQRLLMACFIALVNVESMEVGLPIEIVIRSSFGHNLPSICETDNTFRINVGLIPKQYAEILGKCIHKLNQVFEQLEKTTISASFNANFLKNVRNYNIKKLVNIIDDKPRYQQLKGKRLYLRAKNLAANSDNAFEELYQAVGALNKGKARTGGTNFVPVRLKNMSVWEVLHQHGDTKGLPLLAELFRHNKVVDWFANSLMAYLIDDTDNPVETALLELLGHLRYNDKVTMNYQQIDKDLNQAKYQFSSLSFSTIYKNDPDFDQMTRELFSAFCVQRPNQTMYAALDHAGRHFYTNYRGSKKLGTQPSYGSDSEFSDDISLDETKGKKQKKLTKKVHFSHSKLRVCSGMKAIVLAHYAALSYLKDQGIKNYQYDVDQMYYEVEGALVLVKDLGLRELDTLRTDVENVIMYFDLNYCNASNSSNLALAQKLNAVNPTLVVLDYTSSTHDDVKQAAKQCLAKQNVQLIIMVDSGLKNNQGGQDLNPYGEVRVMAHDRETCQATIETMTAALSQQDKLPQKSHEMVRASKKRGLAFSLRESFKSDKGPYHQTLDESSNNKIKI